MKNPKEVKAGKKAYQARLLKLKEEILFSINASKFDSNVSNAGSKVDSKTSNAASNTCNAASNVASSLGSTRSTNVYIYGVDFFSNYCSWTICFLHL